MSTSKRKLFISLAFWLFLFFMFFNISNYFQPVKFALIRALYNISSIVFMYYLTIWFLFPKYYSKTRRYFIISLFIIIILGILFYLGDAYLLSALNESHHEAPPIQFHLSRFIINLTFTFFVATSISLIEQTTRLQENEKVLTEEKLQTELKLLKAQINPHFIFNALNNIYSLTYMKSENAPDSVLKLSEMLRYVFYDCAKDRVPLSAEIKYIENFNAFQNMKSGFSQNISMKININPGSTEIAPMLFIPFIENAYKYSRIEEIEDAYVNISIEAINKRVHFVIENSTPEKSKSNSGSGMGIENVRHRLLILYPEKHSLNIIEEKHKYIVDLKLET